MSPAGSLKPWQIALVIGAWALALLGALYVDQPLAGWLRSPAADGPARRQIMQRWIDLAYGSAVYLCVPAVLLALPNWKRLLVGWTVPMLLAFLLTHVVKLAVGRARPHLGEGSIAFDPFSAERNMNSFPSGHTSSAVAAAILLGLFFPRARVVFWFFAGCVAAERMVADMHFLSDVLAGAGVGLICVLLCRRLLGESYYRPGLDDAASGSTSASETHAPVA